MGENKVNKPTNPRELQKFTRSLLQDIKSLDYMLQNNWFEKGIHRIGAEQEMCLVDNVTYKPSLIAMEVLNATSLEQLIANRAGYVQPRDQFCTQRIYRRLLFSDDGGIYLPIKDHQRSIGTIQC